MDGVHPPRCVEWRWCVLLLSCPVQWCGSCPTYPIAVLASTAVMSCIVHCRVCGVWVVSVCLWCSCGGVSSVRPPPRRGGGWGYRGWWGGMVSEGRLCCWPPRLVCGVPRPCVGVPFVVYPVALLNGGVCVLCCPPVFGLYPPSLHCPYFSLVLSSPPSSFVCCRVCCVWDCVVVCAALLLCCAMLWCRVVVVCVMNGGVCGGVWCCVVFRYERLYLSFPSPSLCSLSQYC